jgi:hypothetical protein
MERSDIRGSGRERLRGPRSLPIAATERECIRPYPTLDLLPRDRRDELS